MQRVLWLVFVFIVVFAPRLAGASGPYAIPPGCEAVVSELVERALGPDERRSIRIERDHIRVSGAVPDLFTVLIFHPAHVWDSHYVSAEPLALGIVLQCGPGDRPRDCTTKEREDWMERGRLLARERDAAVAAIWQVEVSDETHDELQRAELVTAPERGDLRSDQIIFILVLCASVGLVVLEQRRRSPGFLRVEGFEWGGLATALALLFVCSRSFTWPWPMHEHNSFVARAECALNRYCLEDPAAAWAPTSLNVHGLLHSGFGLGRPVAWLSWLSISSLALSVVVVALVWALARRLTIELGQPELARWAGLLGAGVLAVHPVHWRLAGSGTMWPLTLVAALAAAIAGLWAARQRERWAAALGWSVAAGWIAIVLGGNLVMLTAYMVVAIAPLAWTRLELRLANLRRALIVAAPALLILLVLTESDLRYGFGRVASGYEGGNFPLRRIVAYFSPILLDARASALVWAPLLLLSLVWLVPRFAEAAADRTADHPRVAGWRILLPILLLWGLPHAFLGGVGDLLLTLGYPSAFIHHHWELVGSSVLVGVGGAWALGYWFNRRPPRAPRRTAALASVGVTALGLALGPCATEGWLFATKPSVVERELAALESVLPQLPEHDRLIIAPAIVEDIEGIVRRRDPIEVLFPEASYRETVRAQGREPGRVDRFNYLTTNPMGKDERVLVYVGTSLRSFLPEEIAAGVVPDDLERSELTWLRSEYHLEPVIEFEVETAQHETASMRLGADRSPTVTLGFYILTRHHYD